MTYERSNIASMTGYASGEQPDDPQTIKLNTNENPYPPTPSVSKILADIDPMALRRYPPASSLAFREAAAKIHQVDTDNIIATRGGDELLRLVITTYVEPGQTIGMSDPTYSLYPVLAQIQACPIQREPMTDDWLLRDNFAARMNEIGAKLTFVVNPHAPSGSLLPIRRISEIAEELDGLLLLDEAYIDFVDHDYPTIPLINQFDNLIILRSMSKGYSLAGLRFGYGVAAPSLIEPMMLKTRDSYNLDLIGQKIAEAAISDQPHASETWSKVIGERARVAHSLKEMGLYSSPSQANFILVTVPPSMNCSAGTIYQKLKERHILVRYFDDTTTADKLRISIGTPSENDALLSALDNILHQ